MKTPREFLLNQHQAADAKLDAIRRDVLRAELGRSAQPLPSHETAAAWLFHFLRDFRGQLAAMGAVWLVIALFHLNPGSTASSGAVLAVVRVSPQVIRMAVKENRHQFMELLAPVESRPAETPEFAPGRPRSLRHNEIFAI